MKQCGKHRSVSVLAGLTALLSAGAAVAQPPQAYDRGNNQGVAERPRPDYQASGIPAGGFQFFPTLSAGAEWNDNVFATSEQSAAPKVEDTIARLGGAIRFASDWSRHALNVFANVDYAQYLEDSQDDTTAYGYGADGRIDIYRGWRLDAGANANTAYELRGINDPLNPGGAPLLADPIEYQTTRLNATVTGELNRFRVSLGAVHDKTDFDDGTLVGGGVFDQDFRDGDTTDITARLDLALSPDTALFISGVQGWRSYDSQSPATGGDRDFDVTRALAGASFDITRLVRGEIGVGYTWAKFDDSVAYPDTDGVSVNGRIDWFATQLTTVALTAARNIEQAGIANAASLTRADYGVRIDHELRRNIVLMGDARFTKDEYNDTTLSTPLSARQDDRTSYTAGVDWLLNRTATLNGRYTRAEQDSNEAGRDYEQNIAWVGLTLRR